MNRSSRYLCEIRPTLILALPIIVGQVSQTLMNVTDSMMIGHVGTVPLAAASFGGTLFGLFYVIGIGLLVPVSIFVSRARGAAQPQEAAEYLRHGVAMAVGFGVLETLVLAALSTQLHRFGQPPEVLAIVTPFLLLNAASITPVLVYLALRQFAEAMGRPWLPMYVMLGGVGLNVLLNWVFVFGHLGAPALGLTGSGIATLLARTIGAAVIFAWIRLDPRLRAAWPTQWFAPLARARVREMMHVGLPASGMLFFEVTAFAAAAIMVGWLGAVPLAAHQITLTCASFSFMFPLGLSMAAGIRISHAVGAHELHRLRPIAVTAVGISLAMAAAFGLAYGFGGRLISTWFVKDPVVIALATQLLIVAALFQLFDGWQVTGAALLRGITDVKVPAVITFAAYWLISLPLGYLLGVRGSLGALGIWIGIAGGLACAAVLLSARFARLTRPRPEA
ncbi:MATE family efflux transporter [Opitutus sp. ER46]|uniref:MATE family efflux transporter n=1 Tax=Opitutus sp. ER46 TaxID=2161864 RepID=UPI001E5D14CC|nr:MATE family efflux transporter [Opitutus sp. ER46]